MEAWELVADGMLRKFIWISRNISLLNNWTEREL